MLPGNLGNMKQCVHTWLQLYKCAEISHTCHTAVYHVANRILVSCVDPWISLRELKAQGNFLSLNILNQYPYLVPCLEYLLRILNTAPAHLGNMKKSVCTAQINECAEVGYVLNGSVNGIAWLDSCEQFFFQLRLLCNQKLFPVADDSSSLRIEFCDNKINILSCILGQVLLIAVRYKAGRDKYPCALNLNA